MISEMQVKVISLLMPKCSALGFLGQCCFHAEYNTDSHNTDSEAVELNHCS